MTNSKRQPYGFGSFVKKFTKPIKKIVKSPLGKAALLGGLGWGAHKGMLPGGFGTGWGSKLAQAFGNKEGILAQLFRTKDKATGKYGGVSLGKLGLMGLLGAGTALPFMGEEEEEVVETPWDVMPSSIANLRNQAKNYYTSATPNYLGSPFMPLKEYVQPTFYSAKGGLAQLANGGGVAEAQAEQMLKMEYQKYRNQGGTMSYQQFKMTVLKQAQGRGPMAQGQPRMAQPQMAAEGGIMDLGGMEKDYRAEGGFVPLGKKEKADDVPARLSINEFVFTADAVRNAGGGDIDAGAEVMQNMMKNLEAGGEISPESQGAQGMYNNMKQLETRVA